jgi:Calcineurin-like phosphoesterase
MRDKKDLIGTSRSSVANQLSAIKESITKPAPAYNMDGLIEENKMAWFCKNLLNLGNSRFTPYPSYSDPDGGLFEIQKGADEPVTIALLSDWASDTTESQQVAAQVGTNDYSIHLGDTYYVGNDKEIASNFNTSLGGTWPYGSLGSFAMLGNHEMYSNGQSYFQQLLPAMGNYYADHKQVQETSFFCLENDYWRIIGLDTGYDSLTGWLGLKANGNLDLPDVQKAWLQNTVKLNEDKRGIIILSHHQCFSAFEDEFPNPGKFISSLMQPGRDIIWLWGHEHWFSVYGANQLDNGSNVYARCIGNSGMPVELKDTGGNPKVPKSSNVGEAVNRNLVLYDNRQREVIDATIPLGFNGYTFLNLEGPKLVISYYDDNNMQPQSRKVLEEEWSIDINTGNLSGNSITDLTITSDFPFNLFSDDLNKAIKL